MERHRPYEVHFTCELCGAVNAALRSVSQTLLEHLVCCDGCSGILHEGVGYYALSRWRKVFPGIRKIAGANDL
jgi:hypothetical protein